MSFNVDSAPKKSLHRKMEEIELVSKQTVDDLIFQKVHTTQKRPTVCNLPHFHSKFEGAQQAY